jgi:eukaryotic-like serine/threonine-protein kinase
MSASPSSTDDRLSALLERGRPDEERVHLGREVLLAKLFPQQVARPKLGRYDVLELVGEGGMGTVFTAYDPRLDRRVAIKLLRRTSDEGQRRARLLREAQALARLSHPNVVTVHEVWEEGGEIYVAMELVQGEDLAAWQRERRPWREVLAAYRQAGEGLAAVHDAGMVYRDFKPHNAIRRERDGVVKLLDFGLARIEAEDTLPSHETSGEGAGGDAGPARTGAADRLTRPGAIMGTPAYMAPEQLAGAPVDARSDQFCFCVALWEGLFGQLPVVRALGAGGARLDEHRAEPPRDSDVPGWLRRVLERGLARDPGARYPSMHALLRELGRDRAARRRRALGAAAAVLLTVGGGLVIAELRASATSCVEVRRGIEPVARKAVRAGVLTGAGAGGRETWELLAPRLDRYADALVDAREQTCEAHRRGLVPSEHYALQVACVARREAGLLELIERLERADPAATRDANKAIAELPSPASCGDLGALLAEEPPPADAALAARVGALRQELARVATEEAVGAYARAAERAAAVVDEARALGHAPLRAEALLRWGSARLQAGEAEAMGPLDEALWLSLSTEQRAIAAEAAAKRIYVRVELQGRSAEAGDPIALARALVDRPGAADWRTRWTLDNNVGIALERRSEQSEALAAYERALAFIPAGEADAAEGMFERAMTLTNMGPTRARLGQPREAIDGTRTAVGVLASLLGATHPRLRETEASLAMALRMGGRYAEAEATLAVVLDRYSSQEPPPRWMLMEAARIAWLRGDHDAVLAWCRRGGPRLAPPGGPPTPWDHWFAATRARVAAARGDATALDELDALAEAGPGSIALSLGRSEVLLSLGRGEEAAAVVAPLASNPRLGEWDRVAARLLVGKALVVEARWSEAVPHLEALVDDDERRAQLDPLERAEARQALSVALAGLGRHAEAVRRAELALAALDGFDPDAAPVRAAEAWLDQARRPGATGPSDPG